MTLRQSLVVAAALSALVLAACNVTSNNTANNTTGADNSAPADNAANTAPDDNSANAAPAAPDNAIPAHPAKHAPPKGAYPRVGDSDNQH